MPLKIVSEILGHASVAITGDIYGHVSPDVSREAVAKLAAALSEVRVQPMAVKMAVKPYTRDFSRSRRSRFDGSD